MTLELYFTAPSIPSRAVLLLARALDISLDLKPIDLRAAEQYSEYYLKMCPQHCVPLLVDGDFCLSESGAILIYLAEAYGNDSPLYPKDVKQRAIINQRLFFNDGTLFTRLIQVYLYPVIFQNLGVNDLMMDKVDDGFKILNTYLDEHDWVAGDEISIADYSIITVVSFYEVVGYDVTKYENVSAWSTRCKETMEDYEDLNQIGQDTMAAIFHEKLSKVEQ